jgi:hypothetical protein
MGSRGGEAPDGLPQHRLRTLFLRAPYQDWAALSQGFKQEFRRPMRGKMAERFQAPTPVVLYAVSTQLGQRSEKLMVLAEHHVESLLDIREKPDSLVREGFETYDHFRSYWRSRTRRPYMPLSKVEVFRLRPWCAHIEHNDEMILGALLLERLYDDYL